MNRSSPLSAVCCLIPCLSLLPTSPLTAEPIFKNSVVSNDLDFIRSSDPTIPFEILEAGKSRKEMPDKRSEVLFLEDVSSFKLKYRDGTNLELWVSPDLNRKQARRYTSHVGTAIGKLPRALRGKLSHVVIHSGDETAFAEEKGKFFVLYSQNIEKRMTTHDLEETVFHETTHATLEADFAAHPDWIRAQKVDGDFITEYAAKIPAKEDLPESALFVYTMIKHPGRLPLKVENAVRKTIPNRFKFLSALFKSFEVEVKQVEGRKSGTTTLAEMLALTKDDPGASLGTRPLKRDWVGDITDEDGKIERIRLEKGRIMKGEIALLRTDPNGRNVGSDAPVYVESIPADKMLRSCSTLAELQQLLGPGEGGFSGWVGPKRSHSSHSWICFTTTAENRLTYLDAFAQTSFTRQQAEKGITQIDELTTRKGELRPADPDNPSERKIYLSGADMFAAEEAEKARDRLRFPEPLRTLILADEHPDDSNLNHLSTAIQAIRKAPDPKLFTQLVQEMHEGTLKIRSLLNHILLNEHSLLKLKRWGPNEEAIAVGACIASLPLAKDRAKSKLVEILLRVCGGGKIEIEIANRGSRIEVIPTKNGYKVIYGGAKNPLTLEQAQKELRRLYAQSRTR